MGLLNKIKDRLTGCPDVPVADRSGDRFNVGQYISGLSSFILNCDTPMTISIQGDWGSGKTSMMNMIEANINTLVVPIWFNTWQFSQFSLGNTLAISMMEVLLQRLDGDPGIFETIYDGAKNAVKTVGVMAAEATVGTKAAGAVESAISAAPKSYVTEILALKEQFQKTINNKLKETGRQRVVIFVDDLDRLHPAKAVELLEVLKLFLDCENCVFILAVDYEVVTMGIKQKYGADVDTQKGKSFFDKIIQLPFKMPVAQYDIAGYVRDMMERMKIEVTEQNVGLFAALIKTSIGLNPRSMKRLFNTYQLLDIITKGTVQHIPDNARQRILFATVCLQMYSDALYNYFAAGNIDAERLSALSNVNAPLVGEFIEREFGDGNALDDGDSGNELSVLEEIFGREKFTPELGRILRGLPQFIANFMNALREEKDASITDKETQYLREILQCSAVTSVNNESANDVAGQAWDRRYANRRLVQETNELLKDAGDFAVYQPRAKKDGVISSYAAGYKIERINDEDYKLQYSVDNIDRYGITVSVYFNYVEGYKKGRAEAFYAKFGDNPLDFLTVPVKDSEGWYCYDNMLTVNERDTNAPIQIANLIRDANERMKAAFAKFA